MRLDPFTLEEYQGDIVETTCDSCDNPTTYEQCAYGTDVLVICDDCKPTYTDPENDEDNQSIETSVSEYFVKDQSYGDNLLFV
tara:strand:+ start:110 stop:358 length:249 start_codon:yes stop_codon:yes gene_type:complete